MPLTFNGNTPENVNWNGVALNKVTYNGGVVWEKEAGLNYVEGYGWRGDDLPNKHNAAQMPIATGETTSNVMAVVLRFKLTSAINNGTILMCRLQCGNLSSSTVQVYCYARNTTGDDLSKVNYSSLSAISGSPRITAYWPGSTVNTTINLSSILSTLRTLYSEGERTVDILFKRSGSSESYLKWWLNGKLNTEFSPILYTE